MMSNTMTLDTLAYAKKLKHAGFTEEQAEVQAETLADLLNDRIVNKHALRKALKEQELQLIFKLTSILVIVVGFFTSLLGIFIKLIH